MTTASPSSLSAETSNSLVSDVKIVSSTTIAKTNHITNGYVNQFARKLGLKFVHVDEFGRKYYRSEDADFLASKLRNNKKGKVSVKDIATAAGVSEKTIRNAVNRVLPESVTNGVQTTMSEEEATIVIDELQNNSHTMAKLPCQQRESLSSLTTELTPALKLAQAQQMMAEAYEAMLAYERAEKARVQAHNQQLIVANGKMVEKCAAYDAITDSRGAISIGNCAKVLAFKDIGQNKLFAILRDLHILQGNNTPYQRYIDDGYFRVIEQKYTTPDGETHINFKTLVFQRGIEYIRKQLIINKYVQMDEVITPEAIDSTADNWLEQEGC